MKTTESQREYMRQWYVRNKIRARRVHSKWHKETMADPKRAAKFKARKKADWHRRCATDPGWMMQLKLKQTLRRYLTNKRTRMQCSDLCGCDLGALKAYIQSLFKPGMAWNNYGRRGWVVDHIIPCCRFDLLNPEQRATCFHFSNLQPLWYLENQKKSAS